MSESTLLAAGGMSPSGMATPELFLFWGISTAIVVGAGWLLYRIVRRA